MSNLNARVASLLSGALTNDTVDSAASSVGPVRVIIMRWVRVTERYGPSSDNYLAHDIDASRLELASGLVLIERSDG